MKLIVIILLSAFSFGVQATPTKALPTEGLKNVNKAESATDFSFEDLLVQGKYHFSDEAVTTVEEDKLLDSLIGVRADFKDRMKKSSTSF